MFVRILTLIMLLLLCSCARLDQPKPTNSLQFDAGQMATDSVAFEIGIAQLDNTQIESFEEFWSVLDQQKLPLPVRQRIDQNGLRVAIMASQAPAVLQQLLEPRSLDLEVLDVVEQQLAAKNRMKPKPRMILHERIVNRDGETYPIQTSEIHAEYAWIVRNGELQTVGTGQLVRGLFEIMTLPQGDGSVRLRVTPQIQHGHVQSMIGVAERDFIYDAGQTATRLTDLTFDVTLRPGETLVIAPTADRQDLGRLFFGPATPISPLEPDPEKALEVTADQPTSTNLTHRMLLVRIVQTQLDDVFGKSLSADPLTTTFRR